MGRARNIAATPKATTFLWLCLLGGGHHFGVDGGHWGAGAMPVTAPRTPTASFLSVGDTAVNSVTVPAPVPVPVLVSATVADVTWRRRVACGAPVVAPSLLTLPAPLAVQVTAVAPSAAVAVVTGLTPGLVAVVAVGLTVVVAALVVAAGVVVGVIAIAAVVPEPPTPVCVVAMVLATAVVSFVGHAWVPLMTAEALADQLLPCTSAWWR